jgi:CheY-like chemotaxis protein
MPLMAKPELPTAPSAFPVLRKLRQRPDGTPWLALLADDNPVNLEVGVCLLQRLGMQVHTAEDGDEALQLVQIGRYDLVLMDLEMPRLDGLTATRRLRALPHLQRLPVIALTANVGAESRRDCMDAGMNDFVSKPIDMNVLVNALSRWLPSD